MMQGRVALLLVVAASVLSGRCLPARADLKSDHEVRKKPGEKLGTPCPDCLAGAGGEKVWCTLCQVGHVKGDPVCKDCYKAEKSGKDRCKACRGMKAGKVKDRIWCDDCVEKGVGKGEKKRK